MDWRDDPIASAAVSLANRMEALHLPKDSRLKGVRGGIEITEPGKEPYLLTFTAPSPKPQEER